MKRNIAKMLVVLLMLGTLLPQTAQIGRAHV